MFPLPDLQSRMPQWRKLFRRAGMRIEEVIHTHDFQGNLTQLFKGADGRVLPPVIDTGRAAAVRDARGTATGGEFLEALRSEYTRDGPLRALREQVQAAPHHSTRHSHIVGEVLWRVSAGHYQLVLGEDSLLREIVFPEAHDSLAAGHTGRDKTLERVLRRFCSAATVAAVARIYFDTVLMQHGAPMKIVIDRDPRFQDAFRKELMRLMGVKVAMATPYNPRSDDQAGHTNRVVEDMLRSFVDDNPEDWDLYATNVEFAINDSCSDVTGFTPFELCYGVSPMSQLDMFLEAAQSTDGRRKGGPAIPEAVIVDGQREAHVDRILARRVRISRGTQKIVERTVRWTGYSKAHDSWGTRDKLERGASLQQLKDFEAERLAMEGQTNAFPGKDAG
ncbi:hypothetical protein CYMTET_53043 [Cymbomonas tetramitiformis]|uniref:Integrase catalytic domain-containing protein n=1 Tax=Cymbomonas tetramitiformis TaxID=36881 RepID=A0AAE0EQG1_9CHLO|nr:hypothetical protein CYMTET_53043 [Cymbomonas tetramitiformis]